MEEKRLENVILEKLQKGLLDGVIGNDFVTGGRGKVTYRKIIEDGVPKILRLGAERKYFDNRENIRVAGKVTSHVFNTNEEKLYFFKKYGWLMKDPDVLAYSALFKPKK